MDACLILFDLVLHYNEDKLFGKNVSEITYFV